MRCSCFKATAGVDRNRGDARNRHEIDWNCLRDVNHISYNELKSATNNFHSQNKIGRGGFGIVYKGTLKSGLQVAVKTLAAHSGQGVREFLNEINSISKVRHTNLVELIGCCVDGSNRILVYEYLENNSLDSALLGKFNRIFLNLHIYWNSCY
uniref:Protein kinase domain-containing protein n=1 Tax=Rhizophora mucronata TaxID=61149 RepID=A0A2P2J0P8_RHIMU